jgi:hypothetical protein
MPICTGAEETKVPFVSNGRQVTVPMCEPCAEATRAARRGEDPPLQTYFDPEGFRRFRWR